MHEWGPSSWVLIQQVQHGAATQTECRTRSTCMQGWPVLHVHHPEIVKTQCYASVSRHLAAPTQVKRQKKHTHIKLTHPNIIIATDGQDNRELLHMCVHQVLSQRINYFWTDMTYANPEYNQPAKTIQNTVFTEATFSRLGEINISPNLQEQTQNVKQSRETEEYAPIEGTQSHGGKKSNKMELSNLPIKNSKKW